MQRLELSYCDERAGEIDMLVIHCLAFDVDDALKSFHEAKVSAHYLIAPNGRLISLVPEHKRAWHAGKSFWRGREGLNNFSIGIEICSNTLGQEAYDKRQISALIRLCHRLMRKYHIKPENIVGHSDIAPTRKPDPGKAFPWAYLARHGIGKWYRLKNAARVEENDVAKLLAQIGYDTSDLPAAETAFCRRYLPQLVPTDCDIYHLLENPFDSQFNPQKDEMFLQVLKAVAQSLA